jgi:hypothetical protein
MRLILSAILAVSLLGGCAARVKGPEAEVVVPAISVDSAPRGGGGFCPPGQAKKGRC